MNKVIYAIQVMVLFLSGCSLSTYEAKSLSLYDLCKTMTWRIYTDEAKGVASKEIEARNVDCGPVLRQGAANNAAAGARFFQAQQQLQLEQQRIQNQNTNNLIQSFSNKRQTNCQSYMIGNVMHTNCN